MTDAADRPGVPFGRRRLRRRFRSSTAATRSASSSRRSSCRSPAVRGGRTTRPSPLELAADGARRSPSRSAASCLACVWYAKGDGRRRRTIAASWPGVYRAVANKYYVDEAYDARSSSRGLAQGGGRAALGRRRDGRGPDRRQRRRAASRRRSPGSRRSSTSTSWTASSTASPNTLQAGFRRLPAGADRPRAELRAGDGRRPLLPSWRSICCFDEEMIRKAHATLSRHPDPLDRHVHPARRARSRSSSSSRRRRPGRSRRSRRFVAGLDFVVSLPLWFAFDRGKAGYQFVEKRVAGSRRSASTTTSGSTGSRSLLILPDDLHGRHRGRTARYTAIHERQKEYYVLLLLLQTFMIGTFCCLDFFLFYVFWEVMLVPMYFLIGVWEAQRRLYAAIKFFLYTLAGLGADAARHHRALLLQHDRLPGLQGARPRADVLDRDADGRGARDAGRSCRSGSSSRSSSASRSRCRCSRSTPGCRTPTPRRRRRARSSWRPSC